MPGWVDTMQWLYIGKAEVKAVAAGGKKKAKLSLHDAVVFLTKSPQIQCLAVMALAQGLSTNLIEIAWKSHLHMLHPSPAAYSVRPSNKPPADVCCMHL